MRHPVSSGDLPLRVQVPTAPGFPLARQVGVCGPWSMSLDFRTPNQQGQRMVPLLVSIMAPKSAHSMRDPGAQRPLVVRRLMTPPNALAEDSRLACPQSR